MTQRSDPRWLRWLLALHRGMLATARALALLGGTLLLGLIALTCLSILGRQLAGVLNGEVLQRVAPELAQAVLSLGVGPILGDYELVELGMAIAIFCFLPYCHLSFGHARVDLFFTTTTGTAPHVLRAMTEALFAIALVLIAWQLTLGALGRISSGQTSYLRQVPLWLPYLTAVIPASLAAASSLTLLALRLAEVATHRDVLPDGPEGRK